MNPDDLKRRLDFGLDLTRQAGDVIRGHYQTGIQVERKADLTPVTIADRESEQLMREGIEARYPGDGIIGEEFGETRTGASCRWILDPIDGTKSFSHGVPLFGVLLALEVNGSADLGILHFPALDETVYAARGLGCFWNGRETRVSPVSSLADAVLLTTSHENMELTGHGEAWRRLTDRVGRPVKGAGFTRTWGDCYGYALVATGRAEAMIDPMLFLWDIAAVVPIIEEAGGVVTDFAGGGGHRIESAIATNTALAGEVRSALAPDEREV